MHAIVVRFLKSVEYDEEELKNIVLDAAGEEADACDPVSFRLSIYRKKKRPKSFFLFSYNTFASIKGC